MSVLVPARADTNHCSAIHSPHQHANFLGGGRFIDSLGEEGGALNTCKDDFDDYYQPPKRGEHDVGGDTASWHHFPSYTWNMGGPKCISAAVACQNASSLKVRSLSCCCALLVSPSAPYVGYKKNFYTVVRRMETTSEHGSRLTGSFNDAHLDISGPSLPSRHLANLLGE